MAGCGLVPGAEPDRPVPGDAVREAASAGGKFRWSAGVVARSVAVDFRLDGAGLDGFGLSGLDPGRGDVGLFRGGSAAVVYDDGAVGPSFFTVGGNPDDGTAFGRIDGSDQVFDTGRVDGTGSPILATVFRATDTEVRSGGSAETDRQAGAGPYFQAAWRLSEGPGWMVDAVTGWSFLQTRHGSGAALLGEARETEYRYSYDTLLTVPLPGFPFVDPADFSGSGVFIVDAENPSVADLGRNPVQAGSVRATASWFGSAELAVELDEVPVGVEAGVRLGRWELWGTSGVTVNAVGYELESRLQGTGADGEAIRRHWREEGTVLRAGGFAGVGGRWALGRDGRWFAEARASYRWVEPVQVRAGFASAWIDPTSWEGGLGVGMRW
jgi:hypothetical protein